MRTTTKKTLFKAIFCGFLLAAFFSFFPFAAASEQLPQSVLRLHIIANSNSTQDQEIKLKVRDAVLEEAAKWYGDAATLEQAERALSAHLEPISQRANRVLRENGFSDRAEAVITEMHFSTRYYEGAALPAGKYRTLRVTIGEGRGQNWWCVVFPALCMPAAENREDVLAALQESQREVVENPEKYQIEFQVVEWFESLRGLFAPA